MNEGIDIGEPDVYGDPIIMDPFIVREKPISYTPLLLAAAAIGLLILNKD